MRAMWLSALAVLVILLPACGGEERAPYIAPGPGSDGSGDDGSGARAGSGDDGSGGSGETDGSGGDGSGTGEGGSGETAGSGGDGSGTGEGGSGGDGQGGSGGSGGEPSSGGSGGSAAGSGTEAGSGGSSVDRSSVSCTSSDLNSACVSYCQAYCVNQADYCGSPCPPGSCDSGSGWLNNCMNTTAFEAEMKCQDELSLPCLVFTADECPNNNNC
jgi:hypothetical protein